MSLFKKRLDKVKRCSVTKNLITYRQKPSIKNNYFNPLINNFFSHINKIFVYLKNSLQTFIEEAPEKKNMLYVHEGAIQGIRWHRLDNRRKQKLKEFYRAKNK